MMKRFLFKCIFTPVAAGAMLFASCSKNSGGNDDDNLATNVVKDNTITAQVENGSDYNSLVDTVTAETIVDGEHIVFAKAGYKNGGFTMKLPDAINSRYLHSIYSSFLNATVSNHNAETTGIIRFCAYRSGNETGWFDKFADTETSEACYIYVDRDVSVTGGYTDEYFRSNYIYSLNLKKGWNMFFHRTTDLERNEEYRTKVPLGINLIWYGLIENIDNYETMD